MNLLPAALGALKANIGALLGAEINAQGAKCENEDNFFSLAENADSHAVERIASIKLWESDMKGWDDTSSSL
ncbi:unnamed protein product [Camellia sinensis]